MMPTAGGSTPSLCPLPASLTLPPPHSHLQVRAPEASSPRPPPRPTTVDCEPEATERERMALSGRTRSFSFLLLLFVSIISTAAGGLIGVDYGRDADNLMPPERVVELLKSNGIGAAAIYDADARVLHAFKDSGIKLVVALRNEQLANAARDPNYAGTWVRENVATYYPATQINAIAVGNEVFHQRPDLSSSLVPAMQNVYNALANLRLADAIKVSSPVAFSAVDKSFPPSQGSFRGDLLPFVRPMLEFLSRTGSYFMVNLYPYIAYRDNPNIRLDYTLGLPNPGVRDDNTKLTYYSLLDAQLDAVYSAMAALGFRDAATPDATVGASLQRGVRRRAAIRETGFPSKGGRPPPGRMAWRPASAGAAGTGRKVAMGETGEAGGFLNASLAEERGASVENAQAYNSNLVKRILSGKTGTPLHPNADMDVYIFSLFNENLKKGAESERNFGLFYPDGRKVYDVSFRPGGDSWCVADPAVGTKRMQEALDWACGPGGADCGPIQPGGSCYEPNTVEAHASYAMNSYYQRRGRGAGTCNFSGVGRIVYQRPRFGNCQLPSSR